MPLFFTQAAVSLAKTPRSPLPEITCFPYPGRGYGRTPQAWRAFWAFFPFLSREIFRCGGGALPFAAFPSRLAVVA